MYQFLHFSIISLYTDTVLPLLRKKKFRTFRSGLYHTFFLSMLLPAFIFASFFSAYYNRTLKSEREKADSYLTSKVVTEVTAILYSMNNIASFSYVLPDVTNAITYFDNPDLQYDSLRIQQAKMNYEIAMYRLLLNRQEEFEAASFFPANSQQPCFIASRISAGVIMNTTYQYANMKWYEQALTTRKSFFMFHEKIPGYLKYPENFPVISAVVPIRSLETDKLLGVMIIDVRASRFLKLLQSASIASDDFLLLRTADGQVICQNRELPAAAQRAFTSRNPFAGYKSFSTLLPGTGWTLQYLESNKSVITAAVLTFLFVLAIIAIELVAGFVEYRRHIRRLLHDFERIERTLMEYELGNFDTHAAAAVNPELNRCVDALNELGVTLNEKIKNEYLAVIARQKAEYNALQAQINPHFFYNVLNGFIALNRMGETEKLENSILNLTKLFRYTCKGGNTATVKEELDFAREYLALQQIKYEDRLEYSIEISEEAADFIIPKLILQPLVENSIKYGLEPISRPILIEVQASIVEENGQKKLRLLVADNGAGCEQQKLEELCGTDGHVAVNNIRNRLQLFCSDSEISFTSRKDEGLKVCISLPYEDEGKKHDNSTG